MSAHLHIGLLVICIIVKSKETMLQFCGWKSMLQNVSKDWKKYEWRVILCEKINKYIAALSVICLTFYNDVCSVKSGKILALLPIHPKQPVVLSFFATKLPLLRHFSLSDFFPDVSRNFVNIKELPTLDSFWRECHTRGNHTVCI